MFDDCFVTCATAEAFRKYGFDEPCMAVWHKGPFTTNGVAEEKLYISFRNYDLSSEAYGQSVAQVMLVLSELKKTVPALFKEHQSNQTMPPWLFAAPLYHSAIVWLRKKGLYIHPYRIPGNVNGNVNTPERWSCNITDKDSNILWPAIPFDVNYYTKKKTYYHEQERAAIEQALLGALMILGNEQL